MLKTNCFSLILDLMYRYEPTDKASKRGDIGRFLARLTSSKTVNLDLAAREDGTSIVYKKGRIKLYYGSPYTSYYQGPMLTGQAVLIVIDWLKQLQASTPSGHYLKVL